jgi:hypothetical protein
MRTRAPHSLAPRSPPPQQPMCDRQLGPGRADGPGRVPLPPGRRRPWHRPAGHLTSRAHQRAFYLPSPSPNRCKSKLSYRQNIPIITGCHRARETQLGATSDSLASSKAMRPLTSNHLYDHHPLAASFSTTDGKESRGCGPGDPCWLHMIPKCPRRSNTVYIDRYETARGGGCPLATLAPTQQHAAAIVPPYAQARQAGKRPRARLDPKHHG